MPRFRLPLARAAAALLAACLLTPAAAQAAGTPDIALTASSGSVLFGAQSTVRLNASNGAGQPDGYNLSFRAILPANTTYVAGSGSIAPSRTIAGQPAAGQTTLLWENVSDLSPNSSFGIDFKVAHSTSAFAIGSAFTVDAGAYLNTDPRYVPQFNATTGVPQGPSATSYTGFATATGTQSITAITIDRGVPGSLLRGVHDHQGTATLTITNNSVRPTSGAAVTDWLPAGVEFLGCGGPGADNTTNAPTNPGSAQEYPGSGPIVVPAVPGCIAPLAVDTLVTDPDGGGPLPSGLYTRVQWGLGTLAPGQSVSLPYRMAIPLRENTLDWNGAAPGAGTPPPATGAQAANLDNNAGAETRDDQALRGHAEVTGLYDGTLPVADGDDATTTAEDLTLAKSGSSGALAQGAVTTWTLTFRTGEYRWSKDATVVDTVPSGLCPLGLVNHTTQNSASDAECDPTGALPSVPYTSVTENPNGTFTVTWAPSALAKLARADVNDTWTITMPTRTRTSYQANYQDTTPILAHDAISNGARVDAVSPPRCTSPGTPGCTTPGPLISHDDPVDRPSTGAGAAGQSAAAPVIDKRVAQSGTNCATATYVDTTPSYLPGDRICWRLNVRFPGVVDTSSQSVRDFLPPTMTYEAGSDAPTAANTVGATFDGSGAAQGALAWTITGGFVPTGGRVFERTISSVFNPAGQLAPGSLPGNLMKFASKSTAGTSFPQRDQADVVLAMPVVGVRKGVRQINSGAVNGPNVDGGTVSGGDSVTYRVDLSNTGTADAQDVQVWDRLPAEIDCAQVSAISDGGTCVDGGAARDTIRWTLASLAQGATPSLTYRVAIPASVAPGRVLANTAGVRTYRTTSNLGTPFTYTPASNIDPSLTTTNVPAASDPSNVTVRNVPAPVKTQTTSVTETGNNAGSQATIGETVTYTVTTTIPAGTTLPTGFNVNDTPNNARLAYVAGSVEATLNGSPVDLNWALSEGGATPTPTVTYTAPGGYLNASGDDTLVLTFRAVVRDVAANTRLSGTIANTGRAQWADPVLGAQTRTSNTTSLSVVEPLITQSKSDDAGGGRVVPDQIVTYTLTTANSPASRVSTAHDTSITDTIPAGLTPIGPAPANAPLADGDAVPGTGGATWSAAARTITRTGAGIAPGASVVMTYRARVDNPAVGGAALTNSVTARTTSMSGAVAGERTSASGSSTGYLSTATDTVRLGAATVTKDADRTSATIGDAVTYTATVTIPANVTLYDVTVRDTLPNTLDFDGLVSATCTSGCPPGITVRGYTPAPAGGGALTLAWDLGDVAAHTSPRTVVLVYGAHVRATRRTAGGNVVAGDTAQNAVTVASNLTNKVTFDPASIPSAFDETSAVATRTLTVTEPRITTAKAVSVSGGTDTTSATAQPDDTFGYRIVVTNNGTSAAHDVEVTDRPDAALTGITLASGISTTANVDGWSAADPAMRWVIPGPIAPGDSVTLRYDAALAPAGALRDGQVVTNTARTTSYFGVPRALREANPTWVFRDYANGGSGTVNVTLDFPALAIEKTTGRPGNPESADAEWGAAFPWRVVVRNTSATARATSVAIRDVLPANWSYDAGSASITGVGAAEPVITPAAGGDTLDWATGLDLAPGAAATLTFTATPSLGALLTAPGAGPNVNSARATAKDEAGNAGNADGPYATGPDTASATLLAPDLAISKTPDAGAATAGTAATWSIRVENAGAGRARDLTVTDVLPAGVAYTAGAATIAPAGGFTETSVSPGPGAGRTTVTWTIDALDAGASRTITMPVRVNADVASGATLTNTARVRSVDAPAVREDTGSLLVATSADVRVGKTGPASAVPGDGTEHTYTLTATNDGPSVARAVELRDALPAGVTFVRAQAPCAPDAAEIACALGDLGPGASVTKTVTVTFPASLTGTPANTATVSTTTPDGDGSNDRATWPTTLRPSADVSITKTASAERVNNGGQATFTLLVRNDGPSVARSVQVRDPLPGNLAYVSDDAGCSHATGVVTCDLGDLAPQGERTIRLVIRATAPGTASNEATVTTTTDDPDAGNDRDTAGIEVDPTADLSIAKDGPATAVVGQTVTFTLRVRNDGPQDATGVVATDDLPAGLTFAGSDDGCTEASGTVTCPVGALAAGDGAAVTFRATVGVAAAGTTVRNTATVDGDQFDPDASDDASRHDTAVADDADLRLTKSVEPASVLKGGEATFTLTATNDGPQEARNVTVTDRLPSGLQFVGAPGCTEAAGTVTCDAGTLAKDATATFTVTVRGTANGTWRNDATVASDTHDRDPSNDGARADLVVGPRADLRLTKTGPATVPAGGRIDWEILVENQGPDDATGVVVTDTLPGGVSDVGLPGGCTLAGRTATCSLGTLAAGASQRIGLSATAPVALAGRTLTNDASVDAAEGDGDPSDDRDEARTTVGPAADLRVVKSAPAQVTAGAPFAWTVRVTNDGPSSATGVRIADTLPDGVTLVSAVPTQGTCSGSAPLTCALGAIPVGASVEVTITTVAPAALAGRTIANAVRVGGDQPDPVQANDEARATTTVRAGDDGVGGSGEDDPPTRLDVAKRANVRAARPGSRVRFTLRIRNTGTADAVRLRLCDRLPEGMTYVRAAGAVMVRGDACWRIARLAPGRTATRTLTVRIDRDARPGRRLRNVAVGDAANARRVTDAVRVVVRGPAGRHGAGTRGGVTG